MQRLVPYQPRPIVRLSHDTAYGLADDQLAVEEPLEIQVHGEPIAVTMRTPGHDRDLAIGFCLTEGIIGHPDDLESITICPAAAKGNVVQVRLTAPAHCQRSRQIGQSQRTLYLSSSCGLCGKQTIDRIAQQVSPVTNGPHVSRLMIYSLPQQMHDAQATFHRTGGLHAAAWFTPSGQLRLLREDVGRHNAVDKLIGAGIELGQWPLSDGILLVSGRASFEIMQKAAMARIPIVAAVSAPSTLAVDFAASMNMTLIGFLRDSRMNVYHDPGRLETR